MLYRATGRTTIIAPVRPSAGLLGGIGRRARKPRGTPEPVSNPRDRHRDQMLTSGASGRWGHAPVVARGTPPPRPRPGITSRIWDHDPVKVFSNVYRLGHAAEFSWPRLMEALSCG